MSKKKDITVLKEFRPLNDEEMALELTPILPENVISLERHRTNMKGREIDEREVVTGERSTLGLVGVILSVLSLFYVPLLVAPVGIVVGYLGYRRGDYSLAIGAIGIGVIALLRTLTVSAFL